VLATRILHLVDELLSALKSLERQNATFGEDNMKASMETVLKDLQWFPDEIRGKIDEIYPPPPKPEKIKEEPDEIDTLSADDIFKKFMKTSRRSSDEISIDGPMVDVKERNRQLAALAAAAAAKVQAEGNSE